MFSHQTTTMICRRTTFIGALMPLIIISRFFGAFPMDSNLKFSRGLYIYSLIIGLGCSMFRIYYAVIIPYVRKDSIILSSVLISQGAVVAAWIVYFIYSPRVQEFRRAMNRLEKVSQGNNCFSYPWLCYSVLINMLIRLVILVYMPVKGEEWLKIARKIIGSTVDFYFRAPVYIMPIQFAAVADLTVQMMEVQEKNIPQYLKENNNEILKYHYRLCILMKKVNSYYSPLIFMSLFAMYAFIPPAIYLALRMNEFSLRFMFSVDSEIAFIFYVTLVVIRNCNRLKNQGKLFNEEVHKQARRSRGLLNNKKIQMYIAYDPNIIPHGASFTVDYPIIVQVISTGLTHIVILFQFGKRKVADINELEV